MIVKSYFLFTKKSTHEYMPKWKINAILCPVIMCLELAATC